MKREYKAWAEYKAVNAGPGGFEGYASLFGVLDSGGDIVEAGAFRNTLEAFIKDGFIADGHNWNSVSDGAIGTIVDAHEDARGLFIKTEYHTTQRAQDARRIATERLARGKSVGLSIGYAVRPGGEGMDSAGVRRLRDLDLFEVSHVNVPMLRPAGMTAAKSTAAAVAERPTLPSAPEPPTYAAVRQRCIEAEARGRVPYLRLSVVDVPDEVARTAKATLKTCAADLGLPDPPWLEYFVPATREALLWAEARGRSLDIFEEPEPINGQYRSGRPGRILLRADRTGRDLVGTVAHEARHAWQRVTWGDRRRMDVDLIAADEDDAVAYGAAVQAWYDQGGEL